MKKLAYILAVISLFLGCNRSGKISKKEITGSIIDSAKTTQQELTVQQKEIILPPPSNCEETFDDFFERFGKDSIFQKRRKKYPLKNIYYKDMLDDEVTTELITDRNSYYYKYFDFAEDISATDYEVAFEKKDSICMYKRSGVDNDYYLIFNFKILDGCWFLVSIEN